MLLFTTVAVPASWPGGAGEDDADEQAAAAAAAGPSTTGDASESLDVLPSLDFLDPSKAAAAASGGGDGAAAVALSSPALALARPRPSVLASAVQVVNGMGNGRALTSLLAPFFPPLGRCLVPGDLWTHVARCPEWKMVQSRSGRSLAVLSEDSVYMRIRAAKRESVAARDMTIPLDLHADWRVAAWNHHGTILAFSTSDNVVVLVNDRAEWLHTVDLQVPAYLPGAVDLAWHESDLADAAEAAPAELLILLAGGKLLRVRVPVGGRGATEMLAPVDLSSHHDVALSVAFDPETRAVAVGGGEFVGGKTASTVSVWRLLADGKASCLFHNTSDAGKRSMPFRFTRAKCPSAICRLVFAPNGERVAGLSLDGVVTVFRVATGMEVARAYSGDGADSSPLVDVKWWDDEALILAETSGAVRILSVGTLKSVTESPPPPFNPAPAITAAHDGDFYILDCHRRPAAAGDEDVLTGLVSDGGEEAAAMELDLTGRVNGILRSTGHLRRVHRAWRLTKLSRTTPQTLYERKIESAEWGEAISLAERYGLNTDLVYQKRWMMSDIRKDTIKYYLAKVRDNSWVLSNCFARESPTAAGERHLLNYAIQVAARVPRLEALAAKVQAEAEDEEDVAVSEDESEDEAVPPPRVKVIDDAAEAADAARLAGGAGHALELGSDDEAELL